MPYCRSHVAYPRPGPRAAGGPRGTEREPGVRGASRPQFEPHAGPVHHHTTESELSWPLVSELKQPVYTNLESILGTYSYKQRGKMCSHTTYTEECGPMQQMSWPHAVIAQTAATARGWRVLAEGAPSRGLLGATPPRAPTWPGTPRCPRAVVWATGRGARRHVARQHVARQHVARQRGARQHARAAVMPCAPAYPRSSLSTGG